MKKVIRVIEVLVLLLVISLAVIAIYFVRGVDSYKIDENAVYFVNDSIYTISKGSKAVYDVKEEKIIVEADGKEYTSIGLPLYFNDFKSFLTINDYAYISVKGQYVDGYKMSYLTKFEIDEELIIAKRENNGSIIDNGFLFDGNDTYVLLESTVLKIDDRNIGLSQFSYVIVSKGNWVKHYDTNTREFAIDYITNETDIRILGPQNAYEIIPDVDIITVNGKKTMLFSTPEVYNLYEFGE